ncbi:MAG: hypothetical protein OXC79_03785 [Candidatus Poribacteria bacterium]|nr:hypothetical protein [Candidatus Poribacteria bacterium]
MTKNEILRGACENMIQSPINDLERLVIELKENPQKIMHLAGVDEIKDRLERIEQDFTRISLAIHTLDEFYNFNE